MEEEFKYWEILESLRRDHDLKQKEVAAYLDIKRQQYSRYESGETQMPIKYLIALSNFYGVSTDYILGIPKGRSWPR